MPTAPKDFVASEQSKDMLARFGLTHLLPGFLKRREQEVVEFRALLTQSDFETLRRLAHSLKGSGSNYGFDNLTNLGERLEAAALANDTNLCNVLISEYQEILGTILAQN